MKGYTFISLMKAGGIVMPILLFCSIILVAYTLERLWYYFRVGRIDGNFIIRLKNLIKNGKIKEGIDYCTENKGLLPEVAKAGLESSHLSKSDAEEMMDSVKIRGQNLLRKRLIIFGTLSFISPLLGLLGTVLGLMRSFSDLAVTGSAGPSIIAAGISEALITTIFGIIVAIPSAIIYNYFTSRMLNIMVRIETFSKELLILLYAERIIDRRETKVSNFS